MEFFVFAWIVVGGLLRFVTARVAAKEGRAEPWVLLVDSRWMLEAGRPWTPLARLTLAWGIGGLACAGVFLVGKVADAW